MKARRWSWLGLLVTALFLGAYLWFMVDRYLQPGSHQRPFNTLDFAILTVCFSLLLILLYRTLKWGGLFVGMAAGGLHLIAVVPYFALVDESAHFAYVHEVATHHRIPTVDQPTPDVILALGEHVYPHAPRRVAKELGLAGCMYEAMHPPLYYLCASLIYLALPFSPIVKIYALRLAGLFLFLTVLALLLRLRPILQAGGKDDFLFYTILAAFTLTPGILLRMCTVSNFHLSFLFCVLFFSMLYRAIMEQKEPTLAWAAGFGLITGAAIGTHFFNLFLAVIGALFLASRHQIKRIPLYGAGCGVFIAPWLAFNFHHYHQMTGWKIVYDRMLDIVNPQRQPYTLRMVVDQIPHRFFYFFWNAEESRQDWFLTRGAVFFLSVLLALAAGMAFIRGIRALRSKDALTEVERFSILAIALNFGLLVHISLSQSVPALLGRYLFSSLPACIFLVHRLLSPAPPRVRTVLAILILVSAAMIWNDLWIQGVLYQLQTGHG